MLRVECRSTYVRIVTAGTAEKKFVPKPVRLTSPFLGQNSTERDDALQAGRARPYRSRPRRLRPWRLSKLPFCAFARLRGDRGHVRSGAGHWGRRAAEPGAWRDFRVNGDSEGGATASNAVRPQRYAWWTVHLAIPAHKAHT